MNKVNMISKILKIYKKTASFIGRINAKIILGISYFTVIPVFKVVFLLVKSKDKLGSNWKTKGEPYPDDHKHPF